MRYVTLCALLLLAPLARADDISIDFHLGSYPRLVPVPGYPVYYDPQLPANYFFYDGLYWVYQSDGWYESHWYNGPWHYARPEIVPYYVLRVPVRYYRRPPPYFAGWYRDAPPHWGEYWGHDWQDRHPDWQQWDHHTVPPPAPLPDYQRHYAGAHYPAEESQQHDLRQQNYHYVPREEVTRQRWERQERETQHDVRQERETHQDVRQERETQHDVRQERETQHDVRQEDHD